MILGSVAGVALFYGLVQSAHSHELSARLQSPNNVWIAAVALFFVGWMLTFAIPRAVGWFAVFVMLGGWSASGVAAYSNQGSYAVPLLGLGIAAGAIAVVAFNSDSQLRRPRAA